jgi:hypothetical protein
MQVGGMSSLAKINAVEHVIGHVEGNVKVGQMPGSA